MDAVNIIILTLIYVIDYRLCNRLLAISFRGVNMKRSYDSYARAIKALADETRLRIVHMLAGGELCACKILEEFSITQPTLSYHMKILTDSGLVNGVRDGAWMRYTLNHSRISEQVEFITDIANDTGALSRSREECNF